MTNLAADIGSTYSRPARSGSGLQGTEQVFRNGDFDSLEAVIDAGLAQTGNDRAAPAITRFNNPCADTPDNLALVFNPGDRIYLCGGLSVHLADWFAPARVVRRFCAKGCMADIVTQIPEYHVTRHDTGLSGVTSLVKNIYRADP